MGSELRSLRGRQYGAGFLQFQLMGVRSVPSQFALWAVKAMRQKQRTEDEKVVYLSCPCSERLQEIKAVLQQAGFVVIYALETPPEDAIVIYVHCTLTEREREILQAILSTGSVKSAAAKLGLSINTVHKHLRHMLAGFNVRSTLQLIAIALQKGFIRWEDEPSAEPRSRLVHQRGNFPSAMWDRKITLKGE
jgi:DNA-binding CsgD family transcriptional regulator